MDTNNAAAHRLAAIDAQLAAEGAARHAGAIADYEKARAEMIAAQASPDRDVRWRAADRFVHAERVLLVFQTIR
jgi:hypothetical protein